MPRPAVSLYVGGHAHTIGGEPVTLTGRRCFTAAHPLTMPLDLTQTRALLDSGAFTDPPEKRLTPDAALARQLRWEERARALCAAPEWTAEAVVSYDRLVDETWTAGIRRKARWSLAAAESAVAETIEAARFLASRRRDLSPRALVLACQGVDALQQEECAVELLRIAAPSDWLGLGGWCILGRWQSWLPEFWRTLRLVLPRVAAAGLTRVHLFGVLWQPALGGLLWLADRLGLTVSTDSAAPLLAATRGNAVKAGLRAEGFAENVAWWRDRLTRLRETEHYREPPMLAPARQLSLLT